MWNWLDVQNWRKRESRQNSRQLLATVLPAWPPDHRKGRQCTRQHAEHFQHLCYDAKIRRQFYSGKQDCTKIIFQANCQRMCNDRKGPLTRNKVERPGGGVYPALHQICLLPINFLNIVMISTKRETIKLLSSLDQARQNHKFKIFHGSSPSHPLQKLYLWVSSLSKPLLRFITIKSLHRP